ncbi:TPA: hypothetical protein JI043_05675 [Acinetobacter baumannii]|uniref:hypothetical protein n=1 Tax=Acinetobacter baumannii TaxID=470 RepID=UPI000CE50907|nr:hypothetical protein [Acinetobacter baumannii]NDX80629.1 hypothetical protein [Acinetobacter baumannii]PPC09002.1 hypothetical protein AbaMCR10126_15360 [Acinetobacter baumannii]QJG75773.1 hypothetical protein HB663_05765 [Acinetobacter baumannii]HAV5289365.1 hypothetical protein [Acinetobacter baumannii]HAV5304359.1 hypothetical protein [Acinetobacter baumannii]
MSALIKFPRQHQVEKEKPMFSDKFDNGYIMSSRLYRKEVMPFLSDAARNVYAELENRINGFQKETDFVSYSQLQGDKSLEGSRQLGRATVSSGLKELLDLGVISVIETGKQGTKSYRLNEISLVDRFKNKTSSKKRPVQLVNQSSSVSEPKPVQLVNRNQFSNETDNRYIEKNKNIKNTCSENPVDSVLKLWTPNLDALNAWLQRSGIAKMTQSEVDGWLLEINGYYSTKLEAGLLTDTQMYTNFVKWIKRNFSSRKPAPKAQEQIDSRNVNAAWENIHPDYSNAGEPVELEDWML